MLKWVMVGVGLVVLYDLRREDHMLRDQTTRRLVDEISELKDLPFLM